MSKNDFEIRDTVEFPRISLKDTAELPAIPHKLKTSDVSAQAAVVLNALSKKDESVASEMSEKEKESYYRGRIVEQLNKVEGFLNKILQLYRNNTSTLPEQFSVYNNTLSSNIASLENSDISTRDVIVNIFRIVLPILNELQCRFGHEEDENFNFNETIGEIKTCLSVLAQMVVGKTGR